MNAFELSLIREAIEDLYREATSGILTILQFEDICQSYEIEFDTEDLLKQHTITILACDQMLKALATA